MHPFILAAGRGNRLGSITEDRPKLFIEINGRSIYERQIDVLKQFFGEATVVLGHGFEDRDKATIQEALSINDEIAIDHIVLENWKSFENAFSLQVAIEHHLSRSTDPGDLLIICGDVLFTKEILRKIIGRFEEEYRSTGFNAVGCVPGLQDKMTAVCYNDDGIITDYGEITGHKEISIFVLHERYLQDAQQFLSENPNE